MCLTDSVCFPFFTTALNYFWILIYWSASQIAAFFDATLAKGADAKLAANWIMGDIAAYMKNEKVSITDIKLTSDELAELIESITNGTISGKIGKEVCFILRLEYMYIYSLYYNSCIYLNCHILTVLTFVSLVNQCPKRYDDV